MVEHKAVELPASNQIAALRQRHVIVGWLGLLLFLALGIVLEMMHGFKAGFYLDVQNSSRRLMWTLAHTHGTLFSLIHIAFACSLAALRVTSLGLLNLISKCLIGALVLMPLGFFSGGLWLYGGDPGIGIFLVPIGALLLLAGVAMFCVTLWRDRTTVAKQAVGSAKPTGDQQHSGEKPSRKPPRKRRKK
jgi:hypothetical protein